MTLGAGDYYVVCADATMTAECDLEEISLSRMADPTRWRSSTDATLIDTVSYEGDTGAPYTEGSGMGSSTPVPLPMLGISRVPNGSDTNQNNVDFAFVCITPGGANSPIDSNCGAAGPFLEIFEIQGAASSPSSAADVTTLENVVTASAQRAFHPNTGC